MHQQQEVRASVLGSAVTDDAVKKGSTFRRRTQMHTIVGQEQDWVGRPSGAWTRVRYPLKGLLRPGERVQRWFAHVFGPVDWPKEEER